MNTDNVIKEGFPYEATLEDCIVCIKAGLSGEFKIHQNALAVDSCSDSLSVLCDGSDEKSYVTVLDLTKKRTGFNPRIVSLYPSDFGFSTKQELIDYLSSVALRDVDLKCCLEDSNELAISQSKIFCGVDPFTFLGFFIKQLDATNFKLYGKFFDLDSKIARVDVEITDLIGNPAKPDTLTFVSFTKEGQALSFCENTLTFDDPAAAPGEVYGIVISFFDSNNQSLYAIDLEVVVEGL